MDERACKATAVHSNQPESCCSERGHLTVNTFRTEGRNARDEVRGELKGSCDVCGRMLAYLPWAERTRKLLTETWNSGEKRSS